MKIINVTIYTSSYTRLELGALFKQMYITTTTIYFYITITIV